MSDNVSLEVSQDSTNLDDNTNKEEEYTSVIFAGTSTNSFKLGDTEWFENLPVMKDEWWNSNIQKRNKVSEMWKKSFNDIIDYEIKACKADMEISNLKVQADSIRNKICYMANITP